MHSLSSKFTGNNKNRGPWNAFSVHFKCVAVLILLPAVRDKSAPQSIVLYAPKREHAAYLLCRPSTQSCLNVTVHTLLYYHCASHGRLDQDNRGPSRSCFLVCVAQECPSFCLLLCSIHRLLQYDSTHCSCTTYLEPTAHRERCFRLAHQCLSAYICCFTAQCSYS